MKAGISGSLMLALAGLGILVLSGCARTCLYTQRQRAKGVLLEDVQLCAQKEHDCGATALFIIMRYLGAGISLDKVRDEVFQSFRDSNLSIDMMIFPKHYGFHVKASHGEISDLRASLECGIPPIVCIEKSLPWTPFRKIQRDISEGSRPLLWLFSGSSPSESAQKQGHFMVVLGYDDCRNVLYYCNSQGEVARMPYRRFLSQWRKTSNFLLLLKPLPRKEAVSK